MICNKLKESIETIILDIWPVLILKLERRYLYNVDVILLIVTIVISKRYTTVFSKIVQETEKIIQLALLYFRTLSM